MPPLSAVGISGLQAGEDVKLDWLEGWDRRCVLAVGGLENHLNVLTDPYIVEVAVHNLGHHGDTLFESDIGNAVRIRIAAGHDAEAVDLAFARAFLPFGFTEAERAKCTWIPVEFSARFAALDGQFSGASLFPEIFSARFDDGSGQFVWLIRITHD